MTCERCAALEAEAVRLRAALAALAESLLAVQRQTTKEEINGK